MILVFSQDSWEVTTEEVADWIEALGGECLRVNGEDLNDGQPFALRYDASGTDLHLRLDGRTVDPSQVGAVWWRRGHLGRNLAFVDQVGEPDLAGEMRRHLTEEIRTTSRAMERLLAHAHWLSGSDERRVNKLEALRLAAAAGLDIPATLVTNQRAALREFFERHGRIITKSVAEGRTFNRGGTSYPMYTEEVRREDVDAAPETFFPSLLQEFLEKELEIRTFYLDGKCHSMAIFSQADPQTRLDFRRYNDARPNRNVPYRLPAAVEEAVGRFMRSASLATGSLDFVRTRGGRLVFLEVNPVGQFRMVSEPCNYRLEKQVAEYLMEKDADVRSTSRTVPGRAGREGAHRASAAGVPAARPGRVAPEVLRGGAVPPPPHPGVPVLPVP